MEDPHTLRINLLEDKTDQRFDHRVDEVSKANLVVTALANHRYAAGSEAFSVGACVGL